jgi:hypothetical protein
MQLKSKKKHWKGTTTFGLFGILSGVGAMGATKTILDTIQPNNPDNIKWALTVGGATGVLIGALTASGVLGVRVFSGRKEIINI